MKKLEFIESWINSLPKSLSPSTKKVYRNTLKVFFNQLPEDTILINKSNIDDYITNNRFTKQTYHNYIHIIIRFSKWYGANGGNDFASHIKLGKRDSNISKPITIPQLRKLESIAKSPRELLIYKFTARCGLGPTALSKLNWGDICGNKIYYKNEKIINEYISPRLNISYSDPFFVSESNNNHGRMHPNSFSYIIKAGLRTIGLNDPHLTTNSLRLTYYLIQKIKEIDPDYKI